MSAPTLDELRAAWEAMRHRRCLRHWPADFEDVMRDALRSRLVAIEATAARRRCPAPAVATSTQRRAVRVSPRIHNTPDLFDIKRAAAGDRD